jgi:hypothetical protein
MYGENATLRTMRERVQVILRAGKRRTALFRLSRANKCDKINDETQQKPTEHHKKQNI